MNLSSFFRNFMSIYRLRLKTVLFLFLAGVVVGAGTVFVFPQIMDQILQTFSEKFGEEPALNASLAYQIFEQNATVSAVAWLGGLFLGLPSVFVVLVNGFIIGYVVAFVIAMSPEFGQNLTSLAVGLIPHGIFEIPAFLAAAAMGMGLGLDWLKRENKGQRLKILAQSFKVSFNYYGAILIVLIIAAVIEVFVSGYLLSKI